MKRTTMPRPGRVAAATALLVLFGLGAGHLATPALWAQGGTGGTSTVVYSHTSSGVPCGLQSDPGGVYEEGQYCLENYVTPSGLWRLTTPSSTGCQSPRFFNLVLVPVSLADPKACSVSPYRDYGTGSLSWGTCLQQPANVVYAQVKAPAFMSQPSNWATVVYIRTDTGANPGVSPAFELDYQPLTVTGSSTVSTVTTDGASPNADLYKHIPTRPYRTWVGTFYVPFEAMITR